MVKASEVRSLIQYLINEDEVLRTYIVQFLKELAENDFGIKKDRQQLIVGHLKKSLDKPVSPSRPELLSLHDLEEAKEETILERYLLVHDRNKVLDEYVVKEPEEEDKADSRNRNSGLSDRPFGMDLEENANYKNLNVRVNFHLEMVDLLGICSKGKNFLAETFC